MGTDVAARPRRSEICALLAVAQAHAFAQPPDAMLRGCLLGQWLAEPCGLDAEETETAWWFGLLRYLGCTGHAHEAAVLFGDEIEMRGRSLRHDFTEPAELLREMLGHVGEDKPLPGRVRTVLSMLAGGRTAVAMNFRTGCEVADEFAARMGLPCHVRDCLAFSFERWNGKGFPAGAKGVALPRAARLVHLAQELEVLARIEGVTEALAILGRRAGKAYDPAMVAVAQERAPALLSRLDDGDPWELVLAAGPSDAPMLPAAFDDALTVLADFADVKSPWTAGHSRAVADLVAAAGGTGAGVRAAALTHDLGRVAIPNSIWDKPGPLTRAERDRVETHTLVTAQLLARVPALAELAHLSAAAHECLDGSGYHRRPPARDLDRAARLLAAADRYQAMLQPRAHRQELAPEQAAAELRAAAHASALDHDAVEAVLAAAGHARQSATRTFPAGLTEREVQVLRLVARGRTTKQVAHELVISAKTVDHHLQSCYGKTGVSTRGALALYAVERDLL